MIDEHEQIERLLAYDRELTEQERERVEQHLVDCADCARQLAADQEMEQLVASEMERRRLMLLHSPAYRWDAFYAALDKENERGGWPLWGHFSALMRHGVAVMVLILLAIGLVWIVQGGVPEQFAFQEAPPAAPAASTGAAGAVGPKGPAGVIGPTEQSMAVFGSPPLLELKNYDLEPVQESETWTGIRLRLNWQVVRSPSAEYKRFTHLIAIETDSLGELVAQVDDSPLQGQPPMMTWQPHRLMTESYQIRLPEFLSEGSYALVMGFYDPITGQGLEALSKTTGDIYDPIRGGFLKTTLAYGQVLLGTITLQSDATGVPKILISLPPPQGTLDATHPPPAERKFELESQAPSIQARVNGPTLLASRDTRLRSACGRV